MFNVRQARVILGIAAACCAGTVGVRAGETPAAALGGRLEVLWDMDRIASLDNARLTLHAPKLREVSVVHDKPWEGNICCYHTVFKDVVFMSSRDGQRFNRWERAFLRPGLQRERWVNRNSMIAWGLVETAPEFAGAPFEYSLYSTENYYLS